MIDDRPNWARRITREREARGWSQSDAIRAMRAHSRKEKKELVDDASALLLLDPSLLRFLLFGEELVVYFPAH